MEQEELRKIFAAAVRAPSGENCQPWRFVCEGNTLFLYNLPDRDQSPYNFRQYGSLVSHGAVIENIVVIASGLGYRTEIKLFPRAGDPDCTAGITFIKDKSVQKDELEAGVFLRASNRTPYDPKKLLSEKEWEYLIAHTAEAAIPARLVIEDNEVRKGRIGKALSYGDRLLFENRAVHDFLFGHIYWTSHDAADKKSGFYVKELALTPPQEFIFRLLKKERMRRFFAAIGLPAMAANENAALYAHSSVLGAILTDGNSPRDFINGGRLMERTWLAAATLGYDMQLITAIAFFHQRIIGNEAGDFSGNQIDQITAAYAAVQKEFEVPSEKTIVVMFRMGKGRPLSHRSLRMEPMIEFRT